MANLKLDLVNKLRTDKYFEELELVRLAQDANENYKDKIDKIAYQLEKIAVLNAQIGLAEEYFREAPPQQQPMQMQMNPEQVPVNAPPVGKVHPGQTHGE